jgi:hypothetical protein
MDHFAPTVGLEHAVVATRVGGRFLGWLWHLSIWKPVTAAIVFWFLFFTVAALHANLVAARPVLHEDHVACAKTGAGIVPTCTISADGPGPVISSATFDPRPIANVAGYLSLWILAAAIFTTTGALCVGALRLLCGGTRRSRQVGGVRSGYRGVQSDRRAAKRDAAEVERQAKRVGDWHLRRWGKRWAREDAAGETRSEPGRVGRWLIGRANPPKVRKEKRRAQRAERKAGPADYPPDLGYVPAHLDPTDGPPLSPRQQAEYAERTDGERTDGEAMRQAILAELLAMQTPAPAEPVAAGNGSRP